MITPKTPRLSGTVKRALAFFLLMLAPEVVLAGCGSHVYLAAKLPDDRILQPGTYLPLLPLNSRQPCRGPECSEQPKEIPFVPATTVSIFRADEVAWLFGITPLHTPFTLFRLDLQVRPLKGSSLSIFHPPRS